MGGDVARHAWIKKAGGLDDFDTDIGGFLRPIEIFPGFALLQLVHIHTGGKLIGFPPHLPVYYLHIRVVFDVPCTDPPPLFDVQTAQYQIFEIMWQRGLDPIVRQRSNDMKFEL